MTISLSVTISQSVTMSQTVSDNQSGSQSTRLFRTIGVLTKLDLMDDGTNARSVLDNQVWKIDFLHLLFVIGQYGTVNVRNMKVPLSLIYTTFNCRLFHCNSATSVSCAAVSVRLMRTQKCTRLKRRKCSFSG